MSIETKVLCIIEEQVEAVESTVTRDTPLLGTDLLDSFGLIELLSSLEAAFSIEFDGEALVPENFGTAGAVVDLVLRMLARR
jgi:acyl carrier protein